MISSLNPRQSKHTRETPRNNFLFDMLIIFYKKFSPCNLNLDQHKVLENVFDRHNGRTLEANLLLTKSHRRNFYRNLLDNIPWVHSLPKINW